MFLIWNNIRVQLDIIRYWTWRPCWIQNNSVFLSSNKYANKLVHTDSILFCISLVLTPVTIIENILVQISMYRFRNLRTVTNMFISSLAMADCILGLFTLPLYALFFFTVITEGISICVLKYSTVLLSMSGSLYSLVAISEDRYIAILHSLKYPSILTRKKAKRIIASTI